MPIKIEANKNASGLTTTSGRTEIIGPATIKLIMQPSTLSQFTYTGSSTSWTTSPVYNVSYSKELFYVNYKITKPVTSTNRFSLVLPEGEGGKQKLVLESSTDLVNWTEDSLGSKDSSDKKRFYRLRAVKE